MLRLGYELKVQGRRFAGVLCSVGSLGSDPGRPSCTSAVRSWIWCWARGVSQGVRGKNKLPPRGGGCFPVAAVDGGCCSCARGAGGAPGRRPGKPRDVRREEASTGGRAWDVLFPLRVHSGGGEGGIRSNFQSKVHSRFPTLSLPLFKLALKLSLRSEIMGSNFTPENSRRGLLPE